jgi:hypothetical protein
MKCQSRINHATYLLVSNVRYELSWYGIESNTSTVKVRKISYDYILKHARQRLAKYVPQRYAVNENRRPLLDNVFGYHGITGVSDTTQTWNTVAEPLGLVSSVAAA